MVEVAPAETEEWLNERMALCERMAPHAEQLRDMATAALRYSGQEWRSVDLQVAWITAMFADAVEEELERRE